MSISQRPPELINDPLQARLDDFEAQARTLRQTPDHGEDRRMPCGVYALDTRHILALPRDNGDSRYPYGRDGMNFWVYASGYMHSNEGLFSHFRYAGFGDEPKIAFFAGLPRKEAPDGYDPLPLLSVPRIHNAAEADFQRYSVLSSSAAYYVTTSPQLRFAVRVFITADDDMCFTVLAENLSQTEQRLYLSTYFDPFLRHQLFEGVEDPWFKQISLTEHTPDFKRSRDAGPGFIVKVNEDLTRTCSISNWGVFSRAATASAGSAPTGYEATTSRQAYVGGTRGSLHDADALARGTFGPDRPLCTFVDNAIAGDLTHAMLQPGGKLRLDVVFSFTEQQAVAEKLAGRIIDPADVDRQLAELEKDDDQRHETLRVSIRCDKPDRLQPKVFDAFFEHLKRQVEFCSLLKGYIQLTPNSLIGVRDVSQALEALAAWRSDSARDKLIEMLGYTSPDGRCFRQYSLPAANGKCGKMDLRPFIDQGVWVISCLVSYLKLTGDYGILNERVGYHSILDEATGAVEPARESDSVLEHLFRIMRYLLDHRDHGHTGCIRALYGDWNDALDGLGVSMDPTQAYGTGVSVMATLQVYQNCHEMISLLQTLDPKRHAKAITSLRKDAESIRKGLMTYAITTNDRGEKRILHGWGDRRSYLVGSFNDPDDKARDGLTSNAFWVLSGMLEHDPDMAGVILDAFDRLDGKYGLNTFLPAFAPDVRGVGRICKLPPGTAENGAAYVHATAFAIMALFKMGQPQRAWDQLIKILPFTQGHENLSHTPFVMPNSYGYNPDRFIDGQNMNDWQTGSSNVVLKTLNRYVFGFEPSFDGLWIQPAGWAPFQGFHATCTVRGCQITIESDSVMPRGRNFLVNGKRQEATYDPKMGIDKLWLDDRQLAEGVLDIRITD